MKKSLKLIIMMTVCLLFFGQTGSAAPDLGILVGNTMTPFSLPALNGQSITVEPTGKVLIINFWATWCPPCRGEMPDLNAYYLQKNDDVTFYAVNLQEESSKVNDFMYKNNYSMPTLTDINGTVGGLYQIKYIPTTLVIDRNGVIQLRKNGAITQKELTDVVNKLL